jgi:hypothetical protein
MRAATQPALRILAAAIVLGACSDPGPTAVRAPAQVHRVALGGSETLAGSLNLSVGSYGNWNVSIPSGATSVHLVFDGRIDWSYTAGNSTILHVAVNGYTVTGTLQKGSTYTYPNRGGTESYFDNRGSYWGQGQPFWGLFWSPDFYSNNNSSDYYYVQGANAYTYDLDVSSLIRTGQVNTVNWVYIATGISPTIALQNVYVTAN